MLKNHLITMCPKWSAMYIKLIPFQYLQVYLLSNKSWDTTCFNSSVSTSSGISHHEALAAHSDFWCSYRRIKAYFWPVERHIVSFKIQHVTHYRCSLTFHTAKYYHAVALKQHETWGCTAQYWMLKLLEITILAWSLCEEEFSLGEKPLR